MFLVDSNSIKCRLIIENSFFNEDKVMEVIRHHIYEFQKGIRNLFLHTCSIKCKEPAEKLLERYDIPYIIYQVSDKKINIFFGSSTCVDVVKSFEKVKLNEYTAEEDFILGIMLGYDRKAQCERYLLRSHPERQLLSA